MADAATSLKLLQLAANHFNQDIWPAEQRLFEAAASGDDADCTDLPVKDRFIRADRLAWLCTNPEASSQVTHRGLLIIGAEIDGSVDVESGRILFPLRTRRCVFREAIVLRNSHLVSLHLEETSVKDLIADWLVVEQD